MIVTAKTTYPVTAMGDGTVTAAVILMQTK
jgi:hypothetical protein